MSQGDWPCDFARKFNNESSAQALAPIVAVLLPVALELDWTPLAITQTEYALLIKERCDFHICEGDVFQVFPSL
jgi:hypothetical protein